MGTRWTLLVIVIVAAALRFYPLDAKSLWLDEALSWRMQGFPVSLMIARTGEEATVHPPLYFGLLHLWTAVFGDSHVALRSLAATASLLVVVAMYFFVRELAWFAPSRWSSPGLADRDVRPTGEAVAERRERRGRSAGLLAAALVAVSPYHIHFAHQVRGYSLGQLLMLVTTWALLRALRAETRAGAARRWSAYALLALAFSYTHNLALFTLAAHAIWAGGYLLFARSSLPARPASTVTAADGPTAPAEAAGRGLLVRWGVVAAAIFLVGYAPWMPKLWGQSENLRTCWVRTLHADDLVRQPYGAVMATSDTRLGRPTLFVQVVVVVVLAALAAAVVTWGWGGALLAVMGLLPAVLLLAYSATSMRSIFDARYLAFAQPAWLAALAAVVAWLPDRPSRWAMGAVLLLWSAHGCEQEWSMLGPESRPGARAAAAFIEEHWRAGDAVVAPASPEFFRLLYYLPRHVEPRLLVATRDRQSIAGGTHLLDEELLEATQLTESPPERLWVVESASYLHIARVKIDYATAWEEVEWKEFEQDYAWERPIRVRHFRRIERGAAQE